MGQERTLLVFSVGLVLLQLAPPVFCRGASNCDSGSRSGYCIQSADNSFCESLGLGCGGENKTRSERDCCFENDNGVSRYRCCNLDWIIGLAVGLTFGILIVVFTSVGIGLCCCFYCARKKRLTVQSSYSSNVYQRHQPTTETPTDKDTNITPAEKDTHFTDPDPPSYKWSLEKQRDVPPPAYSETADSNKL